MFGNNFGNHENVECGLIWILPPNPRRQYDPPQSAPVPLTSVSVVASMVHAVAQVELTQVFANQEKEPIEAIYYFPVDSNGGVTHFHAELEGKTIKGIIKPQEEAKDQYEKAIKDKQTAFLMETNKPDIFKVRIGFLKPGAQVKVVIGYVTEVKNEPGSNGLRFFLPTTVAPRYIPPTEADAKALDLKNMKFSDDSPAPLSIRVNVSIQGNIKSIESPSHQIKTLEMGPISGKTNWTRGIIELAGKTTDMDRDFVLCVTPEDPHIPRLYLEKVDGSTAVMAHLIPSFKLDDQKVELIFVLDRSGSMMGQSIDLAKKALALFLHSAPVDCYFNVVGFGSTYEFLFPESVKYDDGSLKKAIVHASSLGANLGGTEIYKPLNSVYKKPLIPGYLRQIFILTDGEVSNTDQVIGLVKAHAHVGRVFSLGIGDGSSHHLVEGLAEAGGGTSSFVTYAEKVESKVLNQLKNAIQPSLMEVEVSWVGVTNSTESETEPLEINKEKTLLGYGKPLPATNKENSKSYCQVPRKVPPVYDGSQLLVFGLFPKEYPHAATIKAQSPDGPLTLEINLDANNDYGSTGMIHKLAAVKLVRELELEVASFGYIEENGESKKLEESLKKEITELSIKNGVCSKYTSFVAVDTECEKPTNESWVMQTRYVPSQLAHGWHGGSFVTGAPPPAMGMMCSFGGPPVFGSGSRSRTARSVNQMPMNSFSFANSKKKGAVETAPATGAIADGSCEMDMESDDDDDDDMGYGLFDLCDSSEAAAAPKKTSPSNPLHTLVATQSFNGSFSLSNAFASAVGIPLTVLENEAKAKGWDESAFATATAIVYLEQKLADLKESWELVVTKAKKWLEKNFSTQSAEILAGASTFMSAFV